MQGPTGAEREETMARKQTASRQTRLWQVVIPATGNVVAAFDTMREANRFAAMLRTDYKHTVLVRQRP